MEAWKEAGIEPRDRDYFLSRNAAFYRSSACDHAIPPQNAERTFELLLHGTPYADCLIAEDDGGAPLRLPCCSR